MMQHFFCPGKFLQLCLATGFISGCVTGMVESMLQSSNFPYSKFKFLSPTATVIRKVCKMESLANVWRCDAPRIMQ